MINYVILFFLLSLLLNFSLSSSSDPYFKTCFQAKCGDLNITYPFSITNQQNSYCGYPGFEVSCQKGSIPYLNLSGSSYVIKNIWYENQTIEVVNSVFLNSENRSDCSGSIRNLTLGKGLYEFATQHSDLMLLMKCPESILEKNGESVVNCGGLAVVERDDSPELEGLKGECGGVVLVPYSGGEREGKISRSTSLREVLSRGVLLRWVASNCSDCEASGGQCGYNQILSEFQCYCSGRPHSHQCLSIKRRSKSIIIGSVTAASALCTILLAVLVICCQRRRSINKFPSLWTKGTIENQNVETFLKSYGSLAPKRYTYTDIKNMSNSFKDKLGEGGYGHVYKGKLVDGRYVAVKVLKKLKGNGEEFINEVVSIGRTNHVNVVTLLGFCFERKKRALVYELLPNGSLEKFIYGAGNPLPLPGETLLSIAVGIAKGLNYLHRGCNTRILHFDIKPHNILLDEKFCPKISDFGLARLFPKEQSHISTLEARGTIGYIAPEVLCRNFGGVSHKSDVYSFGMMVIDMICGRTDNSVQVQESSELYFPQWIYNKLEVEDEEVALQGITNDEENKLQRKMILVSLWCIQTYPSNRPSMNKVVEMLEGSLESLEMPPKPDLSSPSISLFHSSSTPHLTT